MLLLLSSPSSYSYSYSYSSPSSSVVADAFVLNNSNGSSNNNKYYNCFSNRAARFRTTSARTSRETPMRRNCIPTSSFSTTITAATKATKATTSSSSSSSSSSSPRTLLSSTISRRILHRHDAAVNGFVVVEQRESETATSAGLSNTSQADDEEEEEEENDGSSSSSGGDQNQTETITTTTTMFDLLVGAVTKCLLESDKRRDAKGGGGPSTNSGQQQQRRLVSSSATNWINDEQSFIVQRLLDKCEIKLPNSRTGVNRDDASSFLRWMKATPVPAIVDLSTPYVRQAATTAAAKEGRRNSDDILLSDVNLQLIDQTKTQFLNRIICRLILLPSGTPLSEPLWEPPASLVYGKLLYGGVTRYRQIVSSSSSSSSSMTQRIRKAGERTEIKSSTKSTSTTWIQYGGTQRMYEGVDIGPACVLEVVLLPRGTTSSATAAAAASPATATNYSPSRRKTGNNNNNNGDGNGDRTTNDESMVVRQDSDMTIYNFAWSPQDMFEMVDLVGEDEDEDSRSQNHKDGGNINDFTPISQSGKDRNDAFENEFRNAVGGLQPQIDAIVRRVLDGRVLRPVDIADSSDINNSNDTATSSGMDTTTPATAEDETTAALAQASLEARELEILGLTPVRGLLLYGPPGTGKTLLARQIAKALRARAPKIVSAPELLDRWVGGSEKLVRQLFADAEAELASVNGDVTKSALHVIVIDEIDAVFRKRSAGTDSGEQTRASVVNQILAKLDGVNSIDNVLMVGMTNRRELLDEALLRPGRLEVQIEVPLPDREGRREILQIHFDALRRKGRLSRPLCCAIDGIPHSSSSHQAGKQQTPKESPLSSSAGDQTRERKRDKFKNGVKTMFRSVIRSYPDLAEETNGFSGADLAGLVRSAGSLALARARQDGSGLDGLLITLEDARAAIREVKV